MELPRIFSVRFVIPVVLAIAGGWMIFALPGQVLGQSGRGSLPDKKRPDKSRLPAPPPLRVPEQPSPSGGDPDAIRINSDLVTVVTSISRTSPNIPLDLRREDFEVLEDGVPQEIANFTREAEQPLQLVLLFDSSLSVSQKLNFERRAAAKFFERVMRPQDRAALFAVSTDVAILQEFTGQVPVLVNAMKQLRAQGATSVYDGVFRASEYLQPTQGRRVIVIVSDGGDTTSQRSLLEALTAAQRSDVVIFAVFTGNRNLSENLRDLAGERALETMTSETGGLIFRPIATPGTQGGETDDQSIKELDAAFNDLAEQLRTQYTLGFFSTNDKRDGSFRKLSVRVKRPGYGARARRGYYAPKG
ncbi:MAG TPA: VWA domain-containing protein [Blastocatellia bacterium]|nr:VWA domain-containing protein [Blastocatellia bacterium]